MFPAVGCEGSKDRRLVNIQGAVSGKAATSYMCLFRIKLKMRNSVPQSHEPHLNFLVKVIPDFFSV